MAKRKNDQEGDGDTSKKKKTRNDGKTKTVIQDVMKYFGIKGDVREFTIPANLESVCKILDDKISNDTETLHERIERTVLWVSKLKAQMSLFANWLMLYLLNEEHVQLPKLGRPFFCDVMAAVTNRQSSYTTHYQTFCQQTGHQCIDWQPGNSQILEHVRAEMVTVASTYLVNNFFARKLMFLRWKMANTISTYLLSLPQKDQKRLLYAITQRLLHDKGGQLIDYENIQNFPESPNLRESIFNLAHENVNQMTSLRTRLSDRVRDKWVAKKMSNPKNPVTREEALEKFNALSLSSLIKEDPMGVLYYYHQQHLQIQDLPLSRVYRDYTDSAKNDEKTEKKKTWPFWKKLKLPSFSPLPFNTTSRQFIRIDKKTLKEWNLKSNIYDEGLWMNNVFNLYSSKKKGRIHQFQEWKHLNKLEDVELILRDDRDRGRFDPQIHCPVLPGASFTTDGISVHIAAYTFPSKHPNVPKLPDRGYSGITSKVKVGIQDHATGVFKLESMKTIQQVQEFGNCDLVGVDPGCIEVVAHSRIATTDCLQIPNSEQARYDMLDRAKTQSASYSEERYKKNTGRLQAEEKEQQRRQHIQSYKNSLEMLNQVHKKTFDIGKMTTYATARRNATFGLEQELHNRKRSIHRRTRFVRTQRTIAHIAFTVGGGPCRSERRALRKKTEEMLERRKKIIFFGRAQWSGVKGHVTVPRKKLIHVLACNHLVLLVDEYCTSKLCPYDFQELQDIGDRVRQCQTVTHGATVDQLFTMDRDVIGSMNILQKGMFHLLGRDLVHFYQASTADQFLQAA